MQKKVVIWLLVVLFLAFAFFVLLKTGVFKVGPTAISQVPDSVPQDQSITLGGPRIAVIENKQALTTTDIISKAAKEGIAFCDTLEEKYLVEPCRQDYVLTKAINNKDLSICEEGKDSDFIKKCKTDTITTLVAISYKEESKAQGKEVIPSNIGLCDQLEEKDRELCKDPKRVIEKENYNMITVKLKYSM